MNIFIVLRNGPEWTDIVACYEKESDANNMAKDRNARKNMDDVYERLSDYNIAEYELR